MTISRVGSVLSARSPDPTRHVHETAIEHQQDVPVRLCGTFALPQRHYSKCAAAKAAGAASLQPGYRSELDRDKDGIACE
ncbi:excalibur calcium-binding domain-containing protein [Nocardia sputorum]|uniref:excalibur calcium-binding domain-containing protein n=1 Tax=Nocardia sputorum TaxID=2984338 RepID=UPI003D9C842D